jgi:hypothetical protein
MIGFRALVADVLMGLALRASRDRFNVIVSARASGIAMQATMKFLDAEGFRHCAYCASRWSLKRVGGVFVCPGHETRQGSKNQAVWCSSTAGVA